MPIETIRLAKAARDQLISLKRYTHIDQWNILCRWAFCLSLAEPTPPRLEKIPADSNVEMTWKTFAGENDELYMALLKNRCLEDGIPLEESSLNHQFRVHLHRGISYLAGNPNIRSLPALLALACSPAARGESGE